MKDARSHAYGRGAKKAGGGKSQMTRDAYGHQVPGHLGRTKVPTGQGRTGYTEGSKSRQQDSSHGREFKLGKKS